MPGNNILYFKIIKYKKKLKIKGNGKQKVKDNKVILNNSNLKDKRKF